MNLLNQFIAIGKNLMGLGPGRLAALGSVGVLTVALILGATFYLNKPSMETLYVGLDASDMSQISLALANAGIDFQAGKDGSSVQVKVGQAPQARLLLAEQGLPNSANAGYELFDKVGSLGLTSFMQQITRVRALEGEIARTIQQINGISAARVHIVLPDQGSFREGNQKATASVMIRAGASAGRKSAMSIRHLVAASVPGLSPDDVTILDSTGQLLASGDDYSNSAANRSLNTEQQVQSEIENNIDKALSPFLGIDNFRSSVVAKLNTDSQQIKETTYDPNSKVERSVRVTKESQSSKQTDSNTATTVQQNIPQANNNQNGGAGPTSNDQQDKKEETTNYEINSKTVDTVRNSYKIDRLSVAVVVNKARVAKLVGEPVDQAKIDAYVAEMQKVVEAAAGLDLKRGDTINVTVMDFMENQLLADAAASGPGFMEILTRNLSGIINAAAFIVVAFLVVWLGFRPLAKSMGGGLVVAGQDALADMTEAESDSLGLELPDFAPPAVGGPGAGLMEGFGSDFGFDSTDDLLMADDEGEGTFNRRVKEGPERRLARMVEISEERAAKILRKWAIQKAA